MGKEFLVTSGTLPGACKFLGLKGIKAGPNKSMNIKTKFLGGIFYG
ncbi:hypothetical protein [Neomoorella mulderi]|nr:hypothetical protein [Moorella mulderi]